MTGHAILDLLLVACPALGLAFWWTGARAREQAIEHARRACRQRQVQFLDQSVALRRVRPVRLAGGSLGLRRDFAFEFTTAGDFRDTGTVRMRGAQLAAVEFPYTRDEEGHRVWEH